MAKKGFGFTDQWFRDRGYTPDGTGGWVSPEFKNPLKKKQSGPVIDSIVIPKEKVNNSPDFDFTPVTEWFIPYQVPSKKNSRQNFIRNGRQISIPSKRHNDYITATKMYWMIFGKEFRDSLYKLKLNWPVNVEMTFIRSTNQIVDYFGPGETVFDCMTDFKWWPDDNRRFGKPFFGDMQVDKNNPGVRIKILL